MKTADYTNAGYETNVDVMNQYTTIHGIHRKLQN